MIEKMIYFPAGWEAGMKKGYPVIVYCSAFWSEGGMRVAKERETAERNYGIGVKQINAIPYTDAGWKVCESYIEERRDVEDRYKKLKSLAKKAGKKEK